VQSCPLSKSTGGYWNGSVTNSPVWSQGTHVAAQAILSFESRLESPRKLMPRNRQNEDSILRKISDSFRFGSWNTGQSVALGIGDDAALFQPKRGHETILTCDWFLEGTHFFREKHLPDAVGWKCLARAVSDVAAMGGVPRCFLLSLALPETHTGPWLDLFLGGLRRASREFQCALVGGDTTRRSEILINVTVVGEVPAGRALLRSKADTGDIVYVSGRLGEAELGLRILQRSKGMPSKKNALTKKHLYPEPRLALGQWLTTRGLATAMMDLSDGLSSDLSRLCAASSVGAQLESSKIPLVRFPDIALKQRHDPLHLALHGGDDYELLFTVPPRKAKLLPDSFHGVRLTAIGRIIQKRELLLRDENGRVSQLTPRGWDPFRKKL
jgi:thiamine-monophosphate kinase